MTTPEEPVQPIPRTEGKEHISNIRRKAGRKGGESLKKKIQETDPDYYRKLGRKGGGKPKPSNRGGIGKPRGPYRNPFKKKPR